MKQYKVLIIDDSKVMCRINSNIVQQLGITDVDVAFDGKEGLEKFRQKDYDLVMTDQNMPVMTGFEFVQAARKLKSKEECGIFFITTEGDKDEVIKALRLGANNYLVKPVKKEILSEKVEGFFKT